MTPADRMMALFRGFAGAHGTYEEEEFSADKGKQEIRKSARTLRRPVTIELWERHLAGRYHLGVIPICEDSTCWWGAVDIDVYDIDHVALVARLHDLSLPGLVCRTKSGGAHVYLFFSEPVAASELQPRFRELAAALGHGGCEVFPKQIRVVSEDGGNWINMPYYGGDQTKCCAYKPDGLGMSVGQFLTAAEKFRMSRASLLSHRMSPAPDGWDDAPPCLQHLAGIKLSQGSQNVALLSFGVYAKKLDPQGWQALVRRWSVDLCTPPHDPRRVDELIKSLEKKEYGYKCHDAPCASHCNMSLCRTRKYGIGEGGGVDIIDSVSILDTEPPLFYVFLKMGRKVEVDSQTLLNPRNFQHAVLEQLQTVIPHYRQETWLPLVTEAVEHASMIEAPMEVGTTGQFQELLEQFCTDRHAAERRDEIILGKPWRDEESGMVWFRLRDLSQFLDRSKFTKLTPGKVTERIKSMGGSNHFFKVQGRGVNVWGVPVGQLTWVSGQIAPPDQEEGPV